MRLVILPRDIVSVLVCMLSLWCYRPATARTAEADTATVRTFESSLRPAISVAGEPEPHWTLQERMKHWQIPGLSIAVIRDGKLAWAKGYGVLQAGRADTVDSATLFSVGSISKVAAAAIALRLVDQGRLDLDRDVNEYLTGWKLPSYATSSHPVTLRGLLSHSAGLNVHGFADYLPESALPSVIDTLEGRAPALNEPVRVIHPPGAQFLYSGGGTTVVQLLVQEVTQLDFPRAARKLLFDPLGMERSTFENPLPASHDNVAKAHDGEGQPVALPRGYQTMPEMAASGLWTTPSDFARLLIALIEAYRGTEHALLTPALAHRMLTEVGRSPVGLGPFLSGSGMHRRFSHSGANDSYRAWMEGHPASGNGVIIFTNGSNGHRLYPEVRRAVAVAERWPEPLSLHARVPAVELSPDELQEMAGEYAMTPPASTIDFRLPSQAATHRIRYHDGELYLVKPGSVPPERLIAAGATHFVFTAADGTPAWIEFVRNYSGAIDGLVLRIDGYARQARRVAAGSRSP